MSFGENLINLRKQKGWSQDDLADNLNLSRQAISKWENDTSKPDIDNIKKISKIFSVTIDDLLNNDVVKDKAVTLNVKKKEKKERTITIVKCMIIAVIILYIINVIFKFASLLIIVNGIQKYANLSNYHYVITTYDQDGLAEIEECWFKDGKSKTINTFMENNQITKKENISIDYNKKTGYIYNILNNSVSTLNYTEYINFNKDFENGGQLYYKLPIDLRNNKITSIIIKSLSINEVNFNLGEDKIFLKLKDIIVILSKNNLLPISVYYSNQNYNNSYFNIELNYNENVEI